jgi:hypothetical protein
VRLPLLVVLALLAGCGSTPGGTGAAATATPTPAPTCDDRDGFCPPEMEPTFVAVRALTPTVRPGDELRVEVRSQCGSGATFVGLEYRKVGARFPTSIALVPYGKETEVFTARVVVPTDAPPQVAHVLAGTNCSHAGDAGGASAEVRIAERALPQTG